MQFCPHCGATLSKDQNFCTACGIDIRGRALAEQALGQQTTRMNGLGRNTAVYLTQTGLVGARIHPSILLALAFLLPLPLLAVVFIMTNAGVLAVYATVWFASSGLLYDELRWRGLRRLAGTSPEELRGENPWLVPWGSIRMADWDGRTLWFSSEGPTRKGSVTFNQEDAPLVERILTSWGVRLGHKRRLLPQRIGGFWTLVVLLFVTSQAILVLAATLPFFPGEQQVYTTVLNNTRSQIVGASFLGQFRLIYLNNLQVAWGSTIPYLGVLTFGVASYNTGRVIQVIGLLYHTQPSLIILSLFLYPHSWIEELSYPITTIAGVLAVTRWRSVSPEEFTRRLNRGSAKLVLALGGTALSLFVAGFFEILEPHLGRAALFLWVPIGVGCYVLATKKLKRRQRTSHPEGIASSKPQEIQGPNT